MKTISSFCWAILCDSFSEEFGREIHIYNNSKNLTGVELGVNWAAIGTVDPVEAERFAQKLSRAAEIAATHPVNGATIVYA